MNAVTPQPGAGWAELILNPAFNGGDEYPPGMAPVIDAALLDLVGVGLMAGGTPSVLLTFQPTGHGELMVHWCNDGRRPLSDTFDLLDTVTAAQPGVRFLAFCRRPALVRLLAARGWWLHAHEDAPFMALMVCQGGERSTAH